MLSTMSSADELPIAHKQQLDGLAPSQESTERPRGMSSLPAVDPRNFRKNLHMSPPLEGTPWDAVDARCREESVLEYVRMELLERRKQPLKVRLASTGQLLTLLTIIGLCSGGLIFAIHIATARLVELREYVRAVIDDAVGHKSAVGYFAYIAMSAFLAEMANLITRYVGPMAAGSGIPQLKTVLSGVDIPGYLSFRTFVAKVFGIALVTGSGIPVGREGPSAHISAMISEFLFKLKFFGNFKSRSLRLQIIGVAAAVGVASNFRAPFSGVLYSIEVTATYYMLSNYWKGFVGSCVSAWAVFLVIHLMNAIGGTPTKASDLYIFPDTRRLRSSLSYSALNMFMFILIGALMGVLGAMMVHLGEFTGKSRKRLLVKGSRPIRFFLTYLDAPFIAMLSATSAYWMGGTWTEGYLAVTKQFLSPDAFGGSDFGSKPAGIIVMALITAFLMTMCMSLRVPTGAWLPGIVAGAAIGRVIGDMLAARLPSWHIDPTLYAMVAAGSLASGYTRTISTAMIIVEMTGDLDYALPALTGVLVAFGVGNLLSPSVYDALLHINNLPYLPSKVFDINLKCEELMEKNVVLIQEKPSIMDMLNVVRCTNIRRIPVVTDIKDPILIGTVHKRNLVKLLKYFYLANDVPGLYDDLGSAVSLLDEIPESVTATMSASQGRSSALATQLRMLLDNESYSFKTADQLYRIVQDKENQAIAQRWGFAKKMFLETSTITIPEGMLSQISLTVSPKTSMQEVHIMFIMLRCAHLYVTTLGRIVGILTFQDLVRDKKELV